MGFLLKLFPGLAPYALLIELSLIASACALLIGLWTHEVHKHDAKVRAAAIAPYVQAIEKQKAEAAKQFADETAKTKATEAKLTALTQAQNEKDSEHEATVADLSRKLATRSLRDPYARRGPSGGSTPSATAAAAPTGATSSTEGSGLLSAQASGVLRELMLQADQINDAYASCRADAFTVRKPH
jgi:hypothetical protein